MPFPVPRAFQSRELPAGTPSRSSFRTGGSMKESFVYSSIREQIMHTWLILTVILHQPGLLRMWMCRMVLRLIRAVHSYSPTFLQ